MNEHGALKWRFDVSTFRLIGRDLITDRVTALFELVKNCYDANATDVTITFNNVSSKQSDSFISVADNGIGMSFVDIRDKWMVIGTSNKREHSYTPEPIKRRCVGEKGIGRFAVDKLGDIVNIRTKQINEDKWLEVVIDWNAYFDKSKEKGEIQLFTDIENKYSYTDADNISEHGTRLLITGVREAWAKGDIMRFISEISKIVSPFADFSYPFKIRVIAPEFNIDTLASRNIDDVNIATLSFTLDYNTFQGYQEVAKYNELSGNIKFTYDVEAATAGYGQGITVTPIQMLQALTVVANDGMMLEPYVVSSVVSSTGEVLEENKKTELGRVATSATIDKIKELMASVVVNDSNMGTGSAYYMEGYDLIGKTGTASIYDYEKGKYLTGESDYIYSFSGLYPGDNPQLIVYMAV